MIVECPIHGRAAACYTGNQGEAACAQCFRTGGWPGSSALAARGLEPARDEPEAIEEAPATQASAANARQVGGSHYAGSYQHWDFVRELNLDYWQGCATKYISRWRKKNGAEDLSKAMHYIEKRAEAKVSPASIHPNTHWHAGSYYFNSVFRFAHANGLTLMETQAIAHVVRGEWEDACKAIKWLLGEALAAEAIS